MIAKLLFENNTLIPIYSNENGLCVTLEELCFGNITNDKLVQFVEDLKVSDDNITDFYLSVPFEQSLQEIGTCYVRTKELNVPVLPNSLTIDWESVTDQEISFFKRLHKLTQTILCFK